MVYISTPEEHERDTMNPGVLCQQCPSIYIIYSFTLFFFFFFFFRKIELCFCIDGDVEMFFFLLRF